MDSSNSVRDSGNNSTLSCSITLFDSKAHSNITDDKMSKEIDSNTESYQYEPVKGDKEESEENPC